MIRTAAIVLALLNFAFILCKFPRRLHTSVVEIEAVTENRTILTSVHDGLFLLTPEMQIGSQLSNSAHVLFGRPLEPGQNFFKVLPLLVTDKSLSVAHNYIDLLFSPHLKEPLVQGINPLSSVKAAVKTDLSRMSLATCRFTLTVYRA